MRDYINLIERFNLNQNFWIWFTGSKVVDSNGEPLVVHHGTSNPTFKKFSINGGLGGKFGFWFATTEYAASKFATKRYADSQPGIISVFLKIQEPMEYQNYKSFVDDAASFQKATIEDNFQSLRRSLIRRGFDGIVIRNSDTDDGGVRDDWVAFYPNQIKSISNVDFDSYNDSFDK